MTFHPAVLFAVLALLPAVDADAQTEYRDDGEPSAEEEQIRWLLNRGRFDSVRENAVRGSAYTGLPSSGCPLSPHRFLTAAARHHAEDMARSGLLQHETIPGSVHYNAVLLSDFWNRIEAEGYDWNFAGENIASGPSDPDQIYLSWWTSAGHRENMFGADPRDIGGGVARGARGFYHSMTLGSSWGKHFFTGTLFRDDDGSGAYTGGEGVKGIRIELRSRGKLHPHFDISAPAGGFAVPLSGIAAGTEMEVILTNQAAGAVTVSIPRDFDTLRPLFLPAGKPVSAGTFIQPAGSLNSGFRSLTAAPPVIPVSILGIDRSPEGAVVLTWDSAAGFYYQLQWSADLAQWTALTESPLTGTGGVLSAADAPAGSLRFYRLLITAQ